MGGLPTVCLLLLVAAFAFTQLEANSIQDVKEHSEIDGNAEVERPARWYDMWRYGWNWPWNYGWDWWNRPYYPNRIIIVVPTRLNTTSPANDFDPNSVSTANTDSTLAGESIPTTVENSPPPANDTTPLPTPSPGKRDIDPIIEGLQRRHHHPGHHPQTTTVVATTAAPLRKRHVLSFRAINDPLPVAIEERHAEHLHP